MSRLTAWAMVAACGRRHLAAGSRQLVNLKAQFNASTASIRTETRHILWLQSQLQRQAEVLRRLLSHI